MALRRVVRGHGRAAARPYLRQWPLRIDAVDPATPPMVARRMLKTALHVTALALVLGAGVACFGLFGSKDDAAIETRCAGLTGQAKIDCEKQPAP